MYIKYRISIAFVIGITMTPLCLSWYLSSQIMHPHFTCTKEHFIYCGDPSQLDLAFEDIALTASDGTELSAWYLPAKDSLKAIIFVHGHGADRHEGMRWFKAMHSAGFNIVALDLRNSGKNKTSYSTMGHDEKYDVVAALNYLEKNKKIQQVGIFGTSMGAATSIMAMVLDARINAGVFEASWANLADLYTEVIELNPVLPAFLILPTTFWLLEQRTGVDFTQLNPEQLLASLAPRPVFIIHCTGDKLINFSHGERNFLAAKQPKQFWASPCQHHARAWQADPEYIEQRVANYFKNNL